MTHLLSFLLRSTAVLSVLLVSTGFAQVPVPRGKSKEPVKGVKPGALVNEIRPGRVLIDPPTIENLGFRWYVEGDSNRNGTVTVAYRKQGTGEWREALPLLRIHHEISNQDFEPFRVGNLFAGSVLFLEPATTYEVKLTMNDPDGGAPSEPTVVVATTRAEPEAFPGGRTLSATDGGTLMTAYREATPGDVIELAPGTYQGPFRLEKSGEPGKPIVFRGPKTGEAVLLGKGIGHRDDVVSVGGSSHLMFENLSFREARTALYSGKPGSAGITIRRCRISEVINGIGTAAVDSRDWFIADNDIVGINPSWYPRPRDYMSPGHTGVNLYGQGHVVCHNRITRFSDSLAIANFGPPVDDVEKHCVAIDFYHNDLSWAQDDTLEVDYGCHNIRVYRNRCTNAHTALSAQPFYGGPVYFIRNEAHGITSLSYKLNNWPVGILAYHNTTCAARQGFTPPAIWQNGHFRNNLFLGGDGYAMESGSPTPYSTLDHNGYRRNAPDRFLKWTDGEGKVGRYQSIAALHAATGLEAHGFEVDYDVFLEASAPVEGKTVETGTYDLRLRDGASCLDAGVLLPQVNGDFRGRAPDPGCHELGAPLPVYGPRP